MKHIACIHFCCCCGSWQPSQKTGRSFNGPTRRTCPIRQATLTDAQPLSVSSDRFAKIPSPSSRRPLSGPYETSRSSISPPTPRSMNTTRDRSVICAPARSHSEVIQRVNTRDMLRCQKRLQQQCLEFFKLPGTFRVTKLIYIANLWTEF